MGEETDEYVTSSSKLRDTIKAYTGFDILNEAGDGYKDLYEIVLGIGKEWKNLGDLEKAALGEALGGKRNARGLFAIFDNLDILEGAYETSVNSAGSAMKEQEHYAESVQYSIDRTKASLEELAHDFLSSDLLKGLIEGANTFLQKVDEIISKLGTLGTVITGVAAGSTIHGLFTNEGMVAGGIKALTNQKFGEANQRRSMWGNIRQLLGWDEPYYDIEESKSAMAQNTTEEFKDAAAKENTAGASATKTAAIEAETAAMEANTQAIQRNTAAENGDNIADAVEDKIDDVPEIDLPDIDPDNLKKESKKKAETFVESYGDAITDYYDELDGKVKPTDLLDNDYYDELQEFMSENLDDIPSGVMKPAGEAIEAVVDVAEDAIPELADDIAAVGAAAGEGFVSKFVAALSGLGGKIATIFSAIGPAALIGGAVAGALIGKTIYDQVQEAQRKAATSATDKYNERKEQVTGYKDRYETLYKDLHDSSKSEAERVQIREQILGLQQEITGAYGAEAAAVDLVNGELREQLNIMDGLVDKQIEKNNKDPNVKKGYADAKEAMTKRDKYDFGEILDGSSVSRELRNAMNEIEGVDLVDGMEGTGTKIIRFEGDATGAKKAADEVQAILDDLQQKYIDDDNATAVLKHVNESMIPESDRLNDLLDRHHDNYIAGLEQELTPQQRKSVDELGQAIKDVNTAASSGEGFEEAYSNYVDKLNNIKLDSSHMPIIDELKDSLDEAAVSGQNFLDIINDDSHIGNDNQFAKDADLIQGYATSLKELGLQGIDVKEVLNDPLKSTNEGKEQILGLAKAFGVLGDDMKVNEEFVDSFITALLNAGIIADSVADTIEGKADDSFKSFRSSIINDIANIDTLNAAIAESVNGKGLSYSIDENTGEIVGSMATIKNAYADLMDGTEPQALFERTANGIHVNQEKLRELKSELKASKLKEFTEQETNLLKEQQDIRSKINTLTANGVNADNKSDLTNLQSQLDAVGERIGNLKDLRSAWEGATSAYQQWVESQSAGEEGDMYNTIRDTALKRGEELWTAGLTGTNEFRAIAQMLSSEDLTTAPIEKIEKAYQNGSKAVKQFFTDDVDGLLKFSETVQAMGDEVGYVSETDDAYNFFGIDMDAVAEKLGVSRDIVDAIFRRFSDYGYNTRFFDEDQVEELQKIKQGVDEVQGALKDSGDFSVEFGDGSQKSFSDIVDFDFVEIGEDADALNAKLAELQTARADPDINSDQAKLLDELIQLCIQDLDILDGYHASPDGPNLETWKTSQTLLQNFEAEMQELDKAKATPGVNLTIEDSPEAMKIVDAFMNDPDLALMAHIDISKGRDDVIRQLEEMHTKGVNVPINEEKGSTIPESDYKKEGTVSYTEQVEKPLAESEKKQKGILELTPTVAKNAQKRVQKLKGTTETSTKKETIEKNETTTSTKNENTNITVTGNYDEAVKIRTAIASIPDRKEIKIIADTGSAITGINRVAARLESIKDKEVGITVNDGSAITKINTINRMPINPKPLTITHNLDAVSTKLNTVISKLAAIKDKNVTVRVNHVSAGNASANPTTGANGTAHWQGTAGGYYSSKRRGSVGNSFINHYNGTAYARGNWGLKRDEPNALINELGPEIVVLCKICYHVWRHACKITSNC